MNKMITSLCFVLLFTVTVSIFSQGQRRKIGLCFSSKLFPETDIRDAQASIEAWSRELIREKKVDFDIQTYIYDDLKKIEEAIRKKEIGLITLQAIDYLKLRNTINIEPALIGTSGSSLSENFVLLVNKKSRITNTSQLKGKKIALQSSGRGETARIWLETIILKQIPAGLEKFFSEVKYLKNESQLIFQVFFPHFTSEI